MGNKDITEKILEEYDDIFADIVNVLLFGGERRVEPDSLESMSLHSQYKSDMRKLHEQERDVSKRWKKGKIGITIFGIENQSNVDRNMSLRVFGYEGASYRAQYEQKNVAPVVTLVLYFGNKRWNMPKHLKDKMKIPDGLEPYVNDINLNVFEIAWLTDEQLSKFKSDFKVVANYFVNRRKNKDYIPDDTTTIKHVDEVLKLLSAMTGDYRYEEILAGEGEVSNMCEVAQRLVDKGRAESIIEYGHDFGLSDEDILIRLKEKLKITDDKAKAYMEEFESAH